MAVICDFWPREIAPPRYALSRPSTGVRSGTRPWCITSFPNSLFVYHPDYISHLGIYPESSNETLFVHTMLIPEKPTTEKTEAHWRRSFELIDTLFNSEDLVVCEQIQRGLQSGANDALIIGRLEQNLRRFHSNIGAALT